VTSASLRIEPERCSTALAATSTRPVVRSKLATRLDSGSPITGGDPPSCLTALAFAAGPELGPIQTPNGEVTFLAPVGITPDDLAEMKATTTAAVLDRIRASNPLLVTDPVC
jgi:hypothetical protein